MNDFILLTFYNRQSVESPSWEVYGHTAPGVNEMLMAFLTRSQAIEYAHTFIGVPVLQGTRSAYDQVLKSLWSK